MIDATYKKNVMTGDGLPVALFFAHFFVISGRRDVQREHLEEVICIDVEREHLQEMSCNCSINAGCNPYLMLILLELRTQTFLSSLERKAASENGQPFSPPSGR